MAIKFSQRGDFSKTINFLSRTRKNYRPILEKYAIQGVQILRSATPKDSGLTSDSWGYKIETNNRGATIVWTNSNIVDGIPVAILIQYGHGTRSGSFVEGTDYINPAMKPLFDKISEELWKEVANL